MPRCRHRVTSTAIQSTSTCEGIPDSTARCAQGRRSQDKWQDYSLFGHQLVCHYVGEDYRCADYYNPVDGDEVPVAHFGAVLSKEQFDTMVSNLKGAGTSFIIKPTLRFEGAPGEQWTMFFKDPSGNNLEFKHVTNPEFLFARYDVVE